MDAADGCVPTGEELLLFSESELAGLDFSQLLSLPLLAPEAKPHWPTPAADAGQLLECLPPPGAPLPEIAAGTNAPMPRTLSQGPVLCGYELPAGTPPAWTAVDDAAASWLDEDPESVAAAVAAVKQDLQDSLDMDDADADADDADADVLCTAVDYNDDSQAGILAQVQSVLPLITLKRRANTRGPRGTKLSTYEWPDEAYYISRKAFGLLKKLLKDKRDATADQIEDLSAARRRESSRGYSAAQRDHRKAEAAAAGALSERQVQSRKKNLVKTHDKLANQVTQLWGLANSSGVVVLEALYTARGPLPVDASMSHEQLAHVNDCLRHDQKVLRQALVKAGGVLRCENKASY